MMFAYVLARILAETTPPEPSLTPPWTVPLLALVGVVITAGATWLVARRKTSGRIATTEAETLWEQSQAMRRELRDDLVAVRTKATAAERRVEELEQAHEAAQSELEAARNELAQCHEEIARLRREVREYKATATAVHSEVRKLRRQSDTVASDLGAIRAEMSVATSLAGTSTRRKTTPRKRT